MKTEKKGNAFGEVLAEIMGRRGIHFDRASVRGLAERGGMEDVETFVSRVFGETGHYPHSIPELKDELALTPKERELLAYAYAYGKDIREL